MSHLSAALAHCLPELILAAGILVLVLFGALRGKESGGPVTEIAAGLLGFAIVIIFLGSKTTAVVFDGAFIDDGFGRFMKVLTLAGSLVTLIMSQDFLAREKIDKFEFPILILLSTLGMLMLISAAGLIALYLGLELMSLSLYVIAAFHRDNLRASEAGLKYFVLGALSSGMLLYGASLLYGFAGTVSFAGIAETINGKVSLGAIFGLVFLMAGLAFKMSAVPFHMWTPDVYEGAPTPVTAFFATAVKMAAVAITVRVVFTAFPGIVSQWRQIVIFISLLSMVLGAFAAIGQTNIKRL
ncbi:MAG: NADH-quinone oxidoreductase subunit N, partial [Methylocella sp.]